MGGGPRRSQCGELLRFLCGKYGVERGKKKSLTSFNFHSPNEDPHLLGVCIFIVIVVFFRVVVGYASAGSFFH